MRILETDCLVIGTGLAGCSVALSLSDAGHKVLLVTRSSKPEDTATALAQGGIVFQEGENDSPAKLTEDILSAGAGISYLPAVEMLAKEGPPLVSEILVERFKIPFDRAPNGKLHLTDEAAHSLPRILHCHDQTGAAIERKLLNHLAEQSNVTILPKMTAIDLLTLSHHSERRTDMYESPRCIGAYVFDQAKNEVFAVLAKETVLATGGLGQLYLHTTNPPGARGDGLAMAYRTGARIMNLEFVQFHPTALYGKTNLRLLLTEALRGEGAKLINHHGEEFVQRYDKRGALAPRDVVSRAIHDEMLREGSHWVYLDISFKPKSWIESRFPWIYAQCLEQGLDMARQPIPVVPAAHYSCGGVAVDLDGNTTIRNLKAIGEVACAGAHGANRLASTSLLEDLVCGVRAGRDLSNSLKKEKYSFPSVRPWVAEQEAVDEDLLAQDWSTLRQTMWNYVGLVRTPKRLERAQNIFRALSDGIERFYAHSQLSDELIGLRNGATVAELILRAARQNRESLGCHYVRQD